MIRRAQGFTLVESLIALLLLSVGLLGAWALQLASLRAHADSMQQAAATELLRDMAERIRANPTAGARYDSLRGPALEAACAGATACSAEELAASDLAQFAIRAGALFPGSDTAATVEFEPATGPDAADHFTLSLRWRGARDLNSVSLHQLAPPVAG